MSENSNQECEAIGNTPQPSDLLLSNATTKLVGIYGLRNKINGKWYVGQSLVSIQERWRSYKKLKCKSQPKLYGALLKYGYGNFDKIVLEECVVVDWILDYREMYWIKYLDSVKNGYNCTDGGSGGRPSEETKQKQSNSKKGKCTAERNPMFGKFWINDGKVSFVINITDQVPVGCVKGRLYHKELKPRKSQKKLLLKIKIAPQKMDKKVYYTIKNPENSWVGRKHRLESCEKMAVHDRSGCKSPSFGRVWINNGTENRKIMKNDTLPNGYVYGRILVFSEQGYNNLCKK